MPNIAFRFPLNMSCLDAQCVGVENTRAITFVLHVFSHKIHNCRAIPVDLV